MISWEEKFHLGYHDFDFHRYFRRDTRINVMVSDVKTSESNDQSDFTSLLVDPGIPSSFEVMQGNWQVHAHQKLETAVSIRCQTNQIPLLADNSTNLILANAHVVSEHPILVELDCQSVIYNAQSAKKHSIQTLELFQEGSEDGVWHQDC